MAIGPLLGVGPGMDLEILGLVFCHLLDMKAGFLITCGEIGWNTQKMTTGGGTSQFHPWIGAIETVEEITSSMKGKGTKGGYPHLRFHRFLLMVGDGHVMCERGADLLLGLLHLLKTTVVICMVIGVGTIGEAWDEIELGTHIRSLWNVELACAILVYEKVSAVYVRGKILRNRLGF